MENNQNQIIILHGWGSSAERWQTVKSFLNQQFEKTSRTIKIVAPDLPGFKKETALSQVWNLDNYINWLGKLVEDKPLPILIGHSFGGRMAIKFVAQHPEKLKALILISAAGVNRKYKGGKSPWVKLISFLSIFSFLPFFPIFRKLFYKYALRKTDYILTEKFPFLKETFKNIIAEDLTPYLEKIKVPTLIIWGDKDKMTPVSDAHLMNKKIPNSKLEILENIGHAPHLECPEILAEKIQNFIKK